MYILNKIVGWCLSPFGIMFLGLGFGWVLARCAPLRKAGRTLAFLAVLMMWVMGSGITTRFIGVPLEGEEEWKMENVKCKMDGMENGKCKMDGVEAIVLLGGGMGAHAECGRAEMFSGADRVWKAAEEWKMENGKCKIYCSGGGVEVSTVPLLVDLGVPREAIECLDEPRNTAEEAALIAGRGFKRIMLVTSAWHMPRAKMLIERAGLEVVEAPCDYEMHYAAEEPVRPRDFFPSAEALVRNTCAVKEWVARALYRLR